MSNTLSSRIMEEMKAAMKAREQTRLTVLRALKSAIKNAAIEKGGASAELDEAEAIAVVRKQVKQRQDSVESFSSAGRDDLVDKEKAEIEVLETFLPQALSEAEIEAMVTDAVSEVGATSRKEMGQVMKLLQEKTGGRADNKVLSQKVMAALS